MILCSSGGGFLYPANNTFGSFNNWCRIKLPRVWSSLLMVNMEALGTLVSCSLLIFFSPSNKRNDSKVGGAFILLLLLKSLTHEPYHECPQESSRVLTSKAE